MYLMREVAKPTNTETQKWKGMRQFEKVGVRNLAYGSFKPKYRRFRAYFGSYIGNLSYIGNIGNIEGI